MKIITKEEFLDNVHFYLAEIGKGKIFVYGTDTIYGIGCDAENDDAVSKIRAIKKRADKPFSVIVPDKKWIRKNCVLGKNAEKWLDELPGPYTLILELKNSTAVSKKVNFCFGSLGVRIPAHWFAEVIEKYGKPFVTTSVNSSGEPFIKSLDNLTREMKEKIDYAVDEGYLDGNPSTIVKLLGNKEEIVNRKEN